MLRAQSRALILLAFIALPFARLAAAPLTIDAKLISHNETYKERVALAQKGNAKAEDEIAWMYLHGELTVPTNYSDAIYWFEQAAKKDYSDAEFNLGWMHSHGQVFPVDNQSAIYWYERAAKHRNVRAESELGILYESESGSKENYRRALRWFQRASAHGSADGSYGLALMYAKGEGVTQDYGPIRIWYENHLKACDVSSYLGLGKLYEDGNGVAPDESKAFGLYKAAAEECSNTPLADQQLAKMYERGIGTERDLPKALMWLDVALRLLLVHDKYYAEIKTERDTVSAGMTPDQLDEAGKLEGIWFAKHPVPLPIL